MACAIFDLPEITVFRVFQKNNIVYRLVRKGGGTGRWTESRLLELRFESRRQGVAERCSRGVDNGEAYVTGFSVILAV